MQSSLVFASLLLFGVNRRSVGEPPPLLFKFKCYPHRSPRIQLLLMAVFLIPVFTAAQQQPDYARDIRPILSAKCYSCHSAQRNMGGIRLDVREGAFQRGDSKEPTIVAGDSAGSQLIRRVTSDDVRNRMPLGAAALSAKEIALLEAWVNAGASWPAEPGNVGQVASSPKREMEVTARDREFWAFRSLQKVSPPAVNASSWPKTPIDRFILAKLEDKGVAPALVASREKLIRRLYFDLIGLPPDPTEVDAFVNDPSVRAYEHLVEKLLADQHYGERWGRHWLDVARYADSGGYNADFDRLTIYRYRDFVIRAFNRDLPYNEFVRWQIAGDEYAPNDAEAVAATGFLSAGPAEKIPPTDTEEGKERYRMDEVDDMIRTTSEAMLGLTVGCARCHDHKFDPVPTRDYYRIAAIFRNLTRREASLSLPHRELQLWLEAKKLELRDAKIRALGIEREDRALLLAPFDRNNSGQTSVYRRFDKQLQFSAEEFEQWLTEEARGTLRRMREDAKPVEAEIGTNIPESLIVLDNRTEPVPSFLLNRGDVTKPKEHVDFGFLTVLSGGKSPKAYLEAVHRKRLNSTFQRAALAAWLVDLEHGAGNLLARVIVNRIWQHHFGEGLVRTPNDFGLQGERPTHPELLDWLAGELVRNGWRLKPIHRLIVNSAVYKQAFQFNETSSRIDPDNRLLWRRRPVRLEAEIVRDAILKTSGWLNETTFGPAVRPYLPPEATATRARDRWPQDIKDGPERWRRSIYLFVKRSIPMPMMEQLDAPDSSLSCGRRVPTTVPTQGLLFLNNEFIRDQARRFAKRVLDAVGSSRQDQVVLAYRLALGRPPRQNELRSSMTFLAEARTDPSPRDGTSGLVDLCQVLFSLNEFLYVD